MKALIFMALIASGVAANARTCAIETDTQAGQFVLRLMNGTEKRTPTIRELYDLWNANPDLYTHSKQASLMVVKDEADGQKRAHRVNFGHRTRPDQKVQCVSDSGKEMMDYDCDSVFLRSIGYTNGIESPVEIRVPVGNLELRDLLAKDMGCEDSSNSTNSGNSGGSSGPLCTVEQNDSGDLMITSGGGADRRRYFSIKDIYDFMNADRTLFDDIKDWIYIETTDNEFVQRPQNSLPTAGTGDPRCVRKDITGYQCRHDELMQPRDPRKPKHPRGLESDALIIVPAGQENRLPRILEKIGCQMVRPGESQAPSAPRGSQAPLPPPPAQRAATGAAAR